MTPSYLPRQTSRFNFHRFITRAAIAGKKSSLSLIALTLLSISTPASAALLAEYDFNAASVGTAASTAYSNFGSGSYVQSPSVQTPTSYVNPALGFTNLWDGNVLRANIRRNPVGAGIHIVDDATAVQRAAYLSFTYTPTSSTSFTSLNLKAATDTLDPGGEFEEIRPVGMVLRTSLTGLTANDGLDEIIIDYGMELGQIQQLNFDLSGISALQNVSQPVTFYFYMNTQGALAGIPFYVDDIELHGTTLAVPEPKTMCLLALGASSWMLRRRRAKQC